VINMLNAKTLQSFVRYGEPSNETASNSEVPETRLENLRVALEKHGSELDFAWEDLSAEVMGDQKFEPSHLDTVLIKNVLEDAPAELVDALSGVQDLTFDEATSLAQHLQSIGLITELEDFGMWLFRAAPLTSDIIRPDSSTESDTTLAPESPPEDGR